MSCGGLDEGGSVAEPAVLSSQQLHVNPDEADDHVRSLDGGEGHRHPLPRSGFPVSCSVTMGMDTSSIPVSSVAVTYWRPR